MTKGDLKALVFGLVWGCVGIALASSCFPPQGSNIGGVLADGSVPMTGDLDMGQNDIINVQTVKGAAEGGAFTAQGTDATTASTSGASVLIRGGGSTNAIQGADVTVSGGTSASGTSGDVFLYGRNVTFGTRTGAGVNTDRWQITEPNGDLHTDSDNATDIGATGSGRPRTIYAGTSVKTPSIDTDTATSLTIGPSTATSVSVGASDIATNVPGWFNVGASTQAVSQGDMAAGTAASGGLFFDASAGTLSVPGSGVGSEQFGTGTSASAVDATAVGSSASAGLRGVAVGRLADADLDANATAVGYASFAGETGTALGRGASAGGTTNCTALGALSDASGVESTAVGQSAAATGVQAVAVGFDATAGISAVAIGGSSTAGSSGVAVGYLAVAGGDGLAVGRQATTGGFDDATSVGRTATITGNAGTAVGRQVSAGLNGVTVGADAVGAHTASIVFGKSAASTAANQMTVGSTTAPITDVYVGRGATAAAPGTTTYHATDAAAASGAAGGYITFVAGVPDGAGAAGRVSLASATDLLAFHGETGIAKQTVTGSRATGAALTDLLTKLDALGLIIDGSTP